MGQTTQTVDLGSRRAMVLTLAVSALLLVAGLLVMHSGGSLRLGPAPQHPTTAPVTAPSSAPATSRPPVTGSPTPASTDPAAG